MTVTCLIASDAECDREAVTYGLSLADRLNVPLKAMAVFPDPANVLLYATTPYMIGAGGGAIEAVQQAQDKMKAECEAVFGSLCADLEHASFASLTGNPARLAANAAVLGEALVFPRPAARGSHSLTDAFERVMMTTRLPVVLAGSPVTTTGTALIAWDGSDEAGRAVRLHAGLLAAFDRVIIATNPGDAKDLDVETAADASTLAAWLERRGLNSESVEFDGPVAKGLLDIAERSGCELIVAGAYGSSRAGEFLFGGASRGLLHAETGPALALSH